MIRRPPRSTRTDTLFPYTTLFRSNRARNYGLIYSGYGFGIMMVALVAIPVIPHWGWRGLFWLGAIPLVMAPFLWRALPRSFEQLARSGKHAEAVDAGVAFGAASETAEWLEIGRASCRDRVCQYV